MRNSDEQEPMPSLWDELLGSDHQRKDAERTENIPPGYYDDFNYTHQEEDEFGLEAFNQALAKIRRERSARYMENNNNE